MPIQKLNKSQHGMKRSYSKNKESHLMLETHNKSLSKLKEIAKKQKGGRRIIRIEGERQMNDLFIVLILFPKAKLIETKEQTLEIDENLRQKAINWQLKVGRVVTDFTATVIKAKEWLSGSNACLQTAKRALNVLRVSLQHYHSLARLSIFYLLNQNILDLSKEATLALQTMMSLNQSNQQNQNFVNSEDFSQEDQLQRYLSPQYISNKQKRCQLEQIKFKNEDLYNHINAVHFYQSVISSRQTNYVCSIEKLLQMYEEQISLIPESTILRKCECNVLHFCLDKKWVYQVAQFLERRVNSIIAKIAIYVELIEQRQSILSQRTLQNKQSPKNDSTVLMALNKRSKKLEQNKRDFLVSHQLNKKEYTAQACQKLKMTIKRLFARRVIKRLKQIIRPQYVYVLCGALHAQQRQRKSEALDKIFIHSLLQEEKEKKKQRMHLRKIWKAWKHLRVKKQKQLLAILKKKTKKDKAWKALTFMEWRLAARQISLQQRIVQNKFLLRTASRPMLTLTSV